MTVPRANVLLPIIGAVLLGTAACSNDTPGTPLPEGSVASTSRTGERTTEPGTDETTAPSSGDPLDAVRPCDLLTTSAKTELGVTGAEKEKEVGRSRACEWRVTKDTAGDSYTLTVAVFADLGLKDVTADGEKKPLTVGDRSAVQATRGSNAACAISLEVSEDSRVDVQATGGDGAALCAPALSAAELVEAELP